MTLRCAIDGETFVFWWRWNEREATWYVSISDSENLPIVSGVRVVLKTNLLEGVADSRLPSGEIRVRDLTGATAEPTRETLGKSVVVVYVSDEEIEAAA